MDWVPDFRESLLGDALFVNGLKGEEHRIFGKKTLEFAVSRESWMLQWFAQTRHGNKKTQKSLPHFITLLELGVSRMVIAILTYMLHVFKKFTTYTLYKIASIGIYSIFGSRWAIISVGCYDFFDKHHQTILKHRGLVSPLQVLSSEPRQKKTCGWEHVMWMIPQKERWKHWPVGTVYGVI